MLKKLFMSIAVIVLLVLILNIALNIYKNNPKLILNNLRKQIALTESKDFNDYKEWLWRDGRTFVFDIVYANLFSPGTAKLSIKEEFLLDDKPDVFILGASVEESDLFKKIYLASVELISSVQKSAKTPLVYQETIITPEGKVEKKINFFSDVNIAEREGVKFKIPNNTYDPLSVFFNFLASEFKLNNKIVLNLISKEEVYEFKVTPVENKDKIYRFDGEVFRQDKSSPHGAHFSAWIFNGKVRIPLIVKVSTAAGPIYLRLKSVK
jgi:hypothetical protein